MRLEPVRIYPQPKLPSRDAVDEQPDLLRLLPNRWQGNAAVVTALAACLALSTSSSDAAKKPDTVARVAPIFVHGDGIGSFGCRVISPPVFLSEDEAVEVIRNEAKRAGITFAKSGKILSKVELPTAPREYGNKQPARPVKAQSIALDGTDAKRNISFEYVSRDDLVEWQGDPSKNPASSVYSYNVGGAAKDLRAGIAKAKAVGSYAVFYDPVASIKDSRDPLAGWAERPGAATVGTEEARKDLREQVKDFIKWLKAQGVI